MEQARVLLVVLLVARCCAQDQKVLLDFKNVQRNCSGYNEKLFGSWASDSRKWAGVTFAKDGVVSSINLTSWGLCGPLPDSFGNLQGLTSLDLRDNSFDGPLPDTWSRLVQLTALIANQTSSDEYGYPIIIGNITGPLPASFSTLLNLKVLDLAQNNLSGTLPAQYSALQAVTLLRFRSNSLDGTLPPQYSALQALRWLSLTSNKLYGTLPAQYSALQALTLLAFGDNTLTGTLPAQYSVLTLLEILDFSSNTLDGTLPAQYSALQALTYLSVWNNTLTGTLPPQYSALQALADLGFSWNTLTGTLPAQYSALQALTWLSIVGNSLTGTLPAQYSALQALTWLVFGMNPLTGTLPAQYSALQALALLSFSNSTLTGTLPAQYSALQALTLLEFGNNALDGTLPAQYSALQALVSLSVGSNSLDGTLPAQYSVLKLLDTLFLDNNTLTGTLPAQYSALQALTWLSLGSNPFPPQQVPMEWTTSFWNNLQILDMFSMQLTGPLPAIPASADIFNMSNNRLTGSISDIPDVAYLNLAGNKLTGAIPAVNSSDLVYLDLSNNQLSQLPDTFEAPNVTFFSAANNSLSGSIPDYSNHSLAYCDLRNNSLTGSIPQSWTKLNFSFLALGFNKLTGELPDVWEGKVSVLLLQNNSIRGCLPVAWTHNDSMSILSLSNNRLACQLPEDYALYFENMTGIYLDGNKFTGLIPVGWMDGFSSSSKTVLYIGSMWLESSDRSQQRSVLPSSDQNWRKDICLSSDLNARLKGLSKASIPDNTVRQLQSQLDAAMAPVQDALSNLVVVTFQLPPVNMQLSSHPQPSSKQICMNARAHLIVAIQWVSVAFLLVLMVFLYVAQVRYGLLSRLRPKHAISLLVSERAPLLATAGLSLLRLAGVLFYWFDVGTDIYLLRQVFDGDSPWASWVLLAILLLHYVIGAGLLGWYFAANRRYLLVVCVTLVPVMPLVDTAAALLTAAQDAGKSFRLLAVDWQAVFELRHALEFLLESIPMAVMQTAIYVAGNSPRSGVYLDDWTYVLSASGTCLQILGMVALILSRAAKERKSPWQVLRSLLTLPKRPDDVDAEQICLREL